MQQLLPKVVPNPSFGASLSVKQCRNFGVKPLEVMELAISSLKLRRFRLMSYWDEIEKKSGNYSFTDLDKQIALATKRNCQITLCLGARQPRWPESHWPAWTAKMPKANRNDALLTFISTVVDRYKSNGNIVSWQLENEALLKNFGLNGDFDRKRLRQEFNLVKELDPHRPIIMTTSTSWGIPIRRPIPDIVGFSYYRVTYDKGAYRKSIYQPWIFKLRALLIKIIHNRPSFIHELQAEPWGPKNIWEMTPEQQAESMSLDILNQNIDAAHSTELLPIDMWGLEWWYWQKTTQNQPAQWKTVARHTKQ